MAKPIRIDDPETANWCCGLPLIRKRALTVAERIALRRGAGRKRWLCLLWILTPILFLMMLVAMTFMEGRIGTDAEIPFMVACIRFFD